MNELKLFDITETQEYQTLLDCVSDKEVLSIASNNTYKVYREELKSPINIVSFPSEKDYICTIKDENGLILLISFRTAYNLIKKGSTYKYELVEINKTLVNSEFENRVYNLFIENINIPKDEDISRKLILLVKMSQYVQEHCVHKNGITCNYARVLITEFMNNYSYELYMTYKIQLELVYNILMINEVYKNLETAIEIICTAEAIRLGGADFKYYNKLPKYKFLSTFLTKGMTVKEIMRVFSKYQLKQVHKKKLDEFIKDKEVMIDYKDANIPIMYVAVLNEERSCQNG